MNCNIIYINFVRVEDSVHVVFLLHSQMDSTKHCCSVHQVFLMWLYNFITMYTFSFLSKILFLILERRQYVYICFSAGTSCVQTCIFNPRMFRLTTVALTQFLHLTWICGTFLNNSHLFCALCFFSFIVAWLLQNWSVSLWWAHCPQSHSSKFQW